MNETQAEVQQPAASPIERVSDLRSDHQPASDLEVRVTPDRRPRSLLIDVVRGLAITLVVLGHTNQGIAHRSWWGSSTAGHNLQNFIYAFHMPAFFFVSGVFLTTSVDKRGPLHFTLARLRTILYPYLLWTCIYGLASVLFSPFMLRTTPSFHTFLYNLMTGEGGWFLPALFLCLMLGMLTRTLPKPLLFLLSGAMLLWLPPTGISFLDRGVRELPFLALGMWIADSYRQLECLSKLSAALASASLCAALLILTERVSMDANYIFLAFGILGTALLLLIARMLDRTALARGLSWVGQASFGVFLMAPFPQGATRALLQALRVTQPWPQLIASTLIAVLLPAWLYHYRVRLRLGWLFVLPWFRATGIKPAS